MMNDDEMLFSCAVIEFVTHSHIECVSKKISVKKKEPNYYYYFARSHSFVFSTFFLTSSERLFFDFFVNCLKLFICTIFDKRYGAVQQASNTERMHGSIDFSAVGSLRCSNASFVRLFSHYDVHVLHNYTNTCTHTHINVFIKCSHSCLM